MADPLGNLLFLSAFSCFLTLTSLARLEPICRASMTDPLFPYHMAISGLEKLRLISRSPMPDPLPDICSTQIGRNTVERMDDTGGNDHQYEPNRPYSSSTHTLLLYVKYSHREFCRLKDTDTAK